MSSDVGSHVQRSELSEQPDLFGDTQFDPISQFASLGSDPISQLSCASCPDAAVDNGTNAHLPTEFDVSTMDDVAERASLGNQSVDSTCLR